MKQEIAIIGGGAAGFFAAVNCAKKFPQHRVTIYEKSAKLLSKVRVSGGGRCNVTHSCFEITQLVKNYPRGEKNLINAFARFSVSNTIGWFEERGVKLKTEQDGRMFPVTDNSQTIVDCLLEEANKFNVNIVTNAEVKKFSKDEENKFHLIFNDENTIVADKVLIASGGYPKTESFNWLRETGHDIVPPVPSLFTFNIPGNRIVELMGVSVSPVRLRIGGTKHLVYGPVLITHWGLSGPAVLKLSSIAARELAEKKYDFELLVSWITDYDAEQVQRMLPSLKKELGSKQMYNHCPFEFPKRLWMFLLNKINIAETLRWADLSNEQARNLARCLTHDIYKISGKTTFKEEFVTCGGVSLRDVDMKTMESKKCPGLYFAGEVLDIDAVTGGFNFQAAWTGGYIAGINMGK
jgi:predicted Rossmann fold flavoprotein